jgi:hypothetical protein
MDEIDFKTTTSVPVGIDNRIDPEDAPFKARLGERRADDPHREGRQVVATASLRDDPLGLLFARRQIEPHQFTAGRRLQAAFEAVELGGIKAVDPGRVVVDSRGTNFSPSERSLSAIDLLKSVRGHLGKRGYELAPALPRVLTPSWKRSTPATSPRPRVRN